MSPDRLWEIPVAISSADFCVTAINELSKYREPTDHVIFKTLLKNQLNGHIYQLNPACCIQKHHFEDETSDIQRKSSNLGKKKSLFNKIYIELFRPLKLCIARMKRCNQMMRLIEFK